MQLVRATPQAYNKWLLVVGIPYLGMVVLGAVLAVFWRFLGFFMAFGVFLLLAAWMRAATKKDERAFEIFPVTMKLPPTADPHLRQRDFRVEVEAGGTYADY